MNLVLNCRALVLFVAVLVCCANAVAGSASGSFQQTIMVDESIQLDIVTGSGNIAVRAGQAGQVEVVGHIVARHWFLRRSADEAKELVRRFEANPPVELVGGRLQIGHIKDKDFRRNVSISYEIKVPADAEVKSHTGSGSQVVSGVRGPVKASTGSGTLTLTDIGGAVEAHSGSGRIRAEGIAGAFQGHTGSGSVKLVQIAPGDVDVSTGSGSSELSGIEGALRAHSGSGSVTVEGKQDGAWTLDTGSGSIKIRLPEDATFELKARTNSGDIFTDHPITVKGRFSKGRLSGQVRGGGDLLHVETGSGNIRIE